jgi:hypothetical protein
MSTELEQARLIAERIARRVSGSKVSPAPAGSRSDVSAELASVRASLSELQTRLAQLEAKIRSEPTQLIGNDSYLSSGAARSERPVPPTHSPWLAGVNATAAHPSQDRFGVEEAVVSELVDFFEKEKTCTMEPGGKPCDHCAMCSARGF